MWNKAELLWPQHVFLELVDKGY